MKLLRISMEWDIIGRRKQKGAVMSYFPMFVDMEGRKCLIVGGGKVAWRKVKVLQEFGADLKVVAPEIIKDIFEMDEIKCCKRPFEEEDLKSVDFVVAATTDISLNHEISQKCRSLKIPVNAVDQVADCDFIFPSYIKQGEVTGAFTSGGQSPVITKYLKEQAKSYVTEYIGEMAQCLGGIRDEVKLRIKSEENRKKLYQKVLSQGLESGQIPSPKELEKIIELYSQKSEENEWIEQDDFG